MSETPQETGTAQDGVTVQKQETSGEQIGGPATVLPADQGGPDTGYVDPQERAQAANAEAMRAQGAAAQAPGQQSATPQFMPHTAPMGGTANESPSMPPNAVAAAGRAHAMLGHFIGMAKAMQNEIERYVPPELVQMGERDVAAFLRSVVQ